MATKNTTSSSLEWRVSVPHGSTVRLEPEKGFILRMWGGFIAYVMCVNREVMNFVNMVWKLGADDPRKVIHGIKVGVALALVSLFYYTRPLYDGVGGAAMWAVMTVVVVFEFTVGGQLKAEESNHDGSVNLFIQSEGGSLYKGVNRCTATFTAGALAIAVHWIANKSGETMEPIVCSTSLFILASAATFSRFIPAIKRWFDYGITIFILTFSLVAVSGYRVEKLVELAEQRLSTITIGISICLLVAILVFPVWAGNDLHLLITSNMDKLADSIEGCVENYFNRDNNAERNCLSYHKLQGYRCVLNAKASEDSLTNLAKWEPAHGGFGFRHPWTKYQKIGAAMRYCAYCIETLNGCINSDIQAPESIKNNLNDVCINLSAECSKVLRESTSSIISMQRSGTLDIYVEEMNTAVQELQNSLSNPLIFNTPILEALPIVTFATLLIEIAKRVEGVVEAVDNLATSANFKVANDEKPEKIAANAEMA